MSAFDTLALVLEPADLASRLDAPELILVDLTSSARYAAGHLPGARFIDPTRTQLGQRPAPGLLPTQDKLEALFAELGLRDDAGCMPGSRPSCRLAKHLHRQLTAPCT